MMGSVVKFDTDHLTIGELNPEDWKKLHYEFFKNFSSVHTQKCYQLDIEQFILFISTIDEQKIESLADVERVHIVAFRNFLEQRNLAPKTICRKISSVSSYFDFLVEKGFLKTNLCNSIKRPRQDVVTPTNDLSDEQIEKLLSVLHDEKNGSKSLPLHQAVIYLLFSTGIRKSELTQLRGRDFEVVDGHYLLRIRAKGGKLLTKVVHPQAANILQNYLSWMDLQGRKILTDDYLLQPTKNPLIPSQLNRPLGPKSVDYIVKKYCHLAGIYQRISPHSARASYIGSALESGVDLLRVSQDVGHSSVKTTQEYNKRRQAVKDSPAYHLGYFTERKNKS